MYVNYRPTLCNLYLYVNYVLNDLASVRLFERALAILAAVKSF